MVIKSTAMVEFNAIIQKFNKQAEKTGWTYIVVPAVLAMQLQPESKRSFRVKGSLANYEINAVSLLPMGEGDFILPLNAVMRKGLRKPVGELVHVVLSIDIEEIKPPAELMDCLTDEPNASAQFQSLTKSHRNYFINYIATAKTDKTKARRIAQTLNALDKKMDYGQMIRAAKADRKELPG